MTDSKLVQIASTMNSVFPNVVGSYTTDQDGNTQAQNIVLAEDLSNVVEWGKAVDSTYQLGDNFNAYYKKIVDKVGLQVWIYDEWDKDQEVNLRKTSLEAGSIVEMVYFTDPEFIDNTSWDEIVSGSETAPPTFDEMFGYHPVDAKSEYFNRKITLASEVYTVTYLQWKSAVLSPSGLQAFYAAIEQRWTNKMRQLLHKLSKMQIQAYIAGKCEAGYNGVYNVLAEYKKAYPTATTTAATAKTDKEFLRFAKAFVEITRESLRDRTLLYNPKGYIGAVPRSRQKAYLYGPYAEYMSTVLYADTYHDEFVRIGGFDTVSYWQSVGDGLDDETKMKIATKTIAGGSTVFVEGVLGVVFDDRAVFQVDENPRVVAQQNGMSEWTNYQHKLDVSLFETLALNGVVFLISDYVYSREASDVSSAPADWATMISNGIFTKDSRGAYVAVTSGTAWAANTQYFVAV